MTEGMMASAFAHYASRLFLCSSPVSERLPRPTVVAVALRGCAALGRLGFAFATPRFPLVARRVAERPPRSRLSQSVRRGKLVRQQGERT